MRWFSWEHIGTTLLDHFFYTGSQLPFISLERFKRLELFVHPPLHKAVATATGVSYPILGRVSFSVRWGPIKNEITAHVINSLLPDIDLIARQDFLKSPHAVLDYTIEGRVTLTSRAGCQMALRGSSTRSVPTVHNSPERPYNLTYAWCKDILCLGSDHSWSSN